MPVTLLASYLTRVYKRIVSPLNNLANVIEAIRLEDYGLSPKKTFSQGVMAQLLNEAINLVDILQKRKERNNQHVYLIYKLINALDLPVMVFNQSFNLTHANQAFSHWYGQPWEIVKGISSKRIGVELTKEKRWIFIDECANLGWQIKSSKFVNENDGHYLIILNNINSEVRKVQQEAWQQIIRVLTHEIRNSLTPINSMTELMLDKEDLPPALRTPLQVIETRSSNLLTFVEGYVDTTKQIQINKNIFSTKSIIKRILPLYPQHKFEVIGSDFSLYADPVLIEQVIINLIRNSIEALEPDQTENIVTIGFENKQTHSIIKIRDRGPGIINPDNLFVPFYTTKKHGQGIGLAICRNIVEKHNGNLTLTNHPDGGALATIYLPNEFNPLF